MVTAPYKHKMMKYYKVLDKAIKVGILAWIQLIKSFKIKLI